MICVGRWFFWTADFFIAPQSAWVALNDDDAFPLTMETLQKSGEGGLQFSKDGV